MDWIFSTQNLHTFLRRKYFLPPSRGPRDGRGPDPELGAAEGGAGGGDDAAAVPSPVACALVSSAIMLLKSCILCSKLCRNRRGFAARFHRRRGLTALLQLGQAGLFL